MGRLDGKVALITGEARGQGRAHAVRLAQEGAQIVVTDIARQLDSVAYEMPTEADLQETVRLVEDLDQRCVAVQADARSLSEMQGVVEQALTEREHVDIVSVNHGIATFGFYDTDEAAWDEMIDVNLKAVFQTCKAVVPQTIERGQGGAITITASAAGLKPFGAQSPTGRPSTAVLG